MTRIRCTWNIAHSFIFLFTSCAVVCGHTHAAESQRPNILLLLSDDHSYPFVGCYDDGNVKTPTLDRLANEGMKFHRFFTAAPQCVPSRAALMTGRSPVAARMTRFTAPLPRDEITFPELLREQAGYFTGICGRGYHLDGSRRAGAAVKRVFDEHQLRTFAARVDFLNTCPDDEVAVHVAAFLDKKPADKPFFHWAKDIYALDCQNCQAQPATFDEKGDRFMISTTQIASLVWILPEPQVDELVLDQLKNRLSQPLEATGYFAVDIMLQNDPRKSRHAAMSDAGKPASLSQRPYSELKAIHP
jgi:hypothetical protein